MELHERNTLPIRVKTSRKTTERQANRRDAAGVGWGGGGGGAGGRSPASVTYLGFPPEDFPLELSVCP